MHADAGTRTRALSSTPSGLTTDHRQRIIRLIDAPVWGKHPDTQETTTYNLLSHSSKTTRLDIQQLPGAAVCRRSMRLGTGMVVWIDGSAVKLNATRRRPSKPKSPLAFQYNAQGAGGVCSADGIGGMFHCAHCPALFSRCFVSHTLYCCLASNRVWLLPVKASV